MEILRKNQKEILQTKETVRKVINVIEWLINRLDIVEEITSELKNTAVETFKTEKQRG